MGVAAFPQTAAKLRVLAAPGITKNDAKDWHNTLAPDGTTLKLACSKCEPTQVISTPADQIAGLRYGDNAYHHWAVGAVTGFFTLGIGAIVGFMPHHQHFFSIDLKSGKVIALQADKSNYKQIAGMLQNLTGLPIEVSQKEAHFLSG
ncbi:MAG: hypothetical protein ACRD2H_13150 [Terriglobales bacterium]